MALIKGYPEGSDITIVNTGIWKTKAVLYNTDDEFTIYLDGDGIYIEKDRRLVRYKARDESGEQFEKLLSDIEDHLKN